MLANQLLPELEEQFPQLLLKISITTQELKLEKLFLEKIRMDHIEMSLYFRPTTWLSPVLISKIWKSPIKLLEIICLSLLT